MAGRACTARASPDPRQRWQAGPAALPRRQSASLAANVWARGHRRDEKTWLQSIQGAHLSTSAAHAANTVGSALCCPLWHTPAGPAARRRTGRRTKRNASAFGQRSRRRRQRQRQQWRRERRWQGSRPHRRAVEQAAMEAEPYAITAAAHADGNFSADVTAGTAVAGRQTASAG